MEDQKERSDRSSSPGGEEGEGQGTPRRLTPAVTAVAAVTPSPPCSPTLSCPCPMLSPLILLPLSLSLLPSVWASLLLLLFLSCPHRLLLLPKWRRVPSGAVLAAPAAAAAAAPYAGRPGRGGMDHRARDSRGGAHCTRSLGGARVCPQYLSTHERITCVFEWMRVYETHFPRFPIIPLPPPAIGTPQHPLSCLTYY